ncbi:MAG TPA: vitamin K epoxide reductase family protein [Candidatus Acidoferrales bacterium]|nr:vitamin K epoxide reductase family protein [Candidatus Acidoferrales bacterium]
MKSNLYFYVKILASVGIILAIYLLWEQLFHPTFQPCSINSSVNCDAIISGAVSKTLGVPTPLYGLAGYITIFLAAVYRKKKLLLGVATFGLFFCLWIAFRELAQLHVICPVCILCDIDMVTTFTLATIILKKKED